MVAQGMCWSAAAGRRETALAGDPRDDLPGRYDRPEPAHDDAGGRDLRWCDRLVAEHGAGLTRWGSSKRRPLSA